MLMRLEGSLIFKSVACSLGTLPRHIAITAYLVASGRDWMFGPWHRVGFIDAMSLNTYASWRGSIAGQVLLVVGHGMLGHAYWHRLACKEVMLLQYSHLQLR